MARWDSIRDSSSRRIVITADMAASSLPPDWVSIARFSFATFLMLSFLLLES